MHITRHRDFDSLVSHLATWNELAQGVPFRRWDWLEAWWRHYGCHADGSPRRSHELFVLCVWNEDQHLIGIAPWYRVRSRSGSKVIRFLGDGEVCSDYLSLLCRPEMEEAVSAAFADWLVQANQAITFSDQSTNQSTKNPSDNAVTDKSSNHFWDRLEFIGVDAEDSPVNCLLSHLQDSGTAVHHCRPLNTWRLELPGSWEEMLTVLSKQHRNRLRRADREFFQSGKVTVRRVNTPAEFDHFFGILVDLHSRRWRDKGLPGAFASPPFQAFHREISARWSAMGLATLSWLELDGAPLAVEYRLHGEGIMYAYQSGMDTDRSVIRPGELANMVAIRNAIEHGQRAYDFLRGDEEYKYRWRAKPRPMLWVRVVPRHTTARLRHTAWLAGQTVKQWLKRSAKLIRPNKSQSASSKSSEPIGEPA